MFRNKTDCLRADCPETANDDLACAMCMGAWCSEQCFSANEFAHRKVCGKLEEDDKQASLRKDAKKEGGRRDIGTVMKKPLRYNQMLKPHVPASFRATPEDTTEAELMLYDAMSKDADQTQGFDNWAPVLYERVYGRPLDPIHFVVAVKGAYRDYDDFVAGNEDAERVWGLVQMRPNHPHANYNFVGGPETGSTKMEEALEVRVVDPYETDYKKMVITNRFFIACTSFGDPASMKKAPPYLLAHGVPANRFQQFGVAKRLAALGHYVVLFDLLGMGQSDKPLFYGETAANLARIQQGTMKADSDAYLQYWKWYYDVSYIEEVARSVFGDLPFNFYADDWGAAPAMWYASVYGSKRLTSCGVWAPIALSGYYTPEIGTIGRADKGAGQAADKMAAMLGISDPEQVSNLKQLFFEMGMASFPQSLLTILKGMTKTNDVWSQRVATTFFPYMVGSYVKTMRKGHNEHGRRRRGDDIREYYAETGGMEQQDHTHVWVWDDDGDFVNPLNQPAKIPAIQVLSQRSAILSSKLTLPWHPERNPEGIRLRKIDVPFHCIFGDSDNMMKVEQGWRFMEAMPCAFFERIANAGHFVAMDQPDVLAERIVAFQKFVYGANVSRAFVGWAGKLWLSDEENFVRSMKKVKKSHLEETGDRWFNTGLAFLYYRYEQLKQQNK